jgi:hypothetical protein
MKEGAMPKEKVSNRDGSDIRIEVNWVRGGGAVEVATAVDDGSNAVIDAEKAGFVFRGFACILDGRDAVDRLLECLLKARRQAFEEKATDPRICGWTCHHMTMTTMAGATSKPVMSCGCDMRPIYADVPAA